MRVRFGWKSSDSSRYLSEKAWQRHKQELRYCKQIACQLRRQYVEGIYSHAGRTVHQTFNARRSCLGTCMEQPAVVCQECTVADNILSRAEDCTFPVVVWQWLGNRDCTAQYNCCLPTTTDCQRFCPFVCFLLSNFVRCPCNVFDMIASP